jgi:hypothetical protein
MAKFNFYIDRKCTIWVREYHEIEAQDYLQARGIMIDNFRVSATDNTCTMQDVQHDTLDDLDVANNNGWGTAVLINPEGDEIADNTI